MFVFSLYVIKFKIHQQSQDCIIIYKKYIHKIILHMKKLILNCHLKKIMK